MRDFLLFQLYGPLQSYGEIAVGEFRPGYGHPTKSAVVGLFGACLGIKRNERDRQETLARNIAMAVRIDLEGAPLRDFHTVQSPRARKGRSFATRREELVTGLDPGESPYTITTTRDYCVNALFSVCLWLKTEPAAFSLADLQQAMRFPKYAPYLGRKSCPPALPFNPTIIRADRLEDAFEGFAADPAEMIPGAKESSGRRRRICWDCDIETDIECRRVHVRRDDPWDREAWQFIERAERHGELAARVSEREGQDVHK